MCVHVHTQNSAQHTCSGPVAVLRGGRAGTHARVHTCKPHPPSSPPRPPWALNPRAPRVARQHRTGMMNRAALRGEAEGGAPATSESLCSTRACTGQCCWGCCCQCCWLALWGGHAAAPWRPGCGRWCWAHACGRTGAGLQRPALPLPAAPLPWRCVGCAQQNIYALWLTPRGSRAFASQSNRVRSQGRVRARPTN